MMEHIKEDVRLSQNKSKSQVSENAETQVFKRRFPRVFLTGAMPEFPFIKKCEVIWPSGFASGVYDFGRSSTSVYFPMRLNLSLNKNDIIKLGFRIGKNQDIISVDCRVIRSETRLLVIELLRLSKSQINTIANYFADELIAESTHFIDPKYYAPEQTFTHWFHGPQDTNLYVWSPDGSITRVTLELGENVYQWNSTDFSIGPSRDTLSYATEDYAYYTNTITPFRAIAPQSEAALKFRYFVSTMLSTHPVIEAVFKRWSV